MNKIWIFNKWVSTKELVKGLTKDKDYCFAKLKYKGFPIVKEQK